jgi:predicted Holliday junction resolvase-like endonuclease
MSQQHKDLINFLKTNDFKAICPDCHEVLQLKKVDLFSLDEFSPEAIEKLNQMKQDIKQRKLELKELTKKKRAKIEVTTASVNLGFILERLAPALQEFRFEKNDCRSLFDPIDYVIFEGLHKTGKVQKIIFTDIKSGDAKLKNKQKAIKQLVNDKKIEFKTYKP